MLVHASHISIVLGSHVSNAMETDQGGIEKHPDTLSSRASFNLNSVIATLSRSDASFSSVDSDIVPEVAHFKQAVATSWLPLAGTSHTSRPAPERHQVISESMVTHHVPKEERSECYSVAQQLLAELERAPDAAGASRQAHPPCSKDTMSDSPKSCTYSPAIPTSYTSPATAASSAGDPTSQQHAASHATVRGTPPPAGGQAHADTQAVSDNQQVSHGHSPTGVSATRLPMKVGKVPARASDTPPAKGARGLRGAQKRQLPRRPPVSSILGGRPSRRAGSSGTSGAAQPPPLTRNPPPSATDRVRRALAVGLAQDARNHRKHTHQPSMASAHPRPHVSRRRQGTPPSTGSKGGRAPQAQAQPAAVPSTSTTPAAVPQTRPPPAASSSIRAETPQPRSAPQAHKATPHSSCTAPPTPTEHRDTVPRLDGASSAASAPAVSRLRAVVADAPAQGRAQQVAHTAASLRGDWQALKRDTANALSTFNGVMTRVRSALVPAVASIAHRAAQRGGEVQSLQRQLDEARTHIAAARHTAQDASSQAARATQAAAAASAAAADQLEGARRMRDWLGDVRGAVRVLCRVRPAVAGADSGDEGLVQFAGLTPDGSREGLLLKGLQGGSSNRPRYEELVGGGKHLFGRKSTQNSNNDAGLLVFDRVFRPDSTQSDVYNELKGLVRAALPPQPEAFRRNKRPEELPPKRLCVFAWGATGSGKTHTLWGGSGDASGVVPRALADVFRSLHQRCSEALHSTSQQPFSDTWNNNAFLSGVSVVVSVWEVLHDSIQVLLPPPADSVRQGATASTSAIVPRGVHEVPVNSFREAFRVLSSAARSRAQCSTQLNASSSRGHLLCSVRLAPCGTGGRTGIDGATPQAGHLLFVDLAGAERALEAGTVGDTARLREAGGVNRGLGVLAQILKGMAAGAHVQNAAVGNASRRTLPFRDSPLTQCLRPYLGVPGARVAMLATASPEAGRARETQRTLRFAAAVAAAVPLR